MPILTLDCGCTPVCPPTGGTQGPPGPIGPIGPQGTAGINGRNAFSFVTGSGFTVPSVGSNVTVTVDQSAWMAQQQVVFVQTAGYYRFIQAPSSTQCILQNLGIVGINAAPLTTIGVGVEISPGGEQGAQGPPFVPTSPIAISIGGTGQATKILGFDALSPLSPATKGQLITTDGSHNIALSPGSDGNVLIANSSASQGLQFVAPSMLGFTFNGFSPLTTIGDLVGFDGTNNVRVPLPGGAQNGWALQVDSTSTVGFSWALNTAHGFTRILKTTTPAPLDGSEFLVAVKNASTGPVSVILAPGTFYTNKFLIVKCEKGDEDVNPVTISTPDGSLIEGQSTFLMDNKYAKVWIYFDGVQFQLL